MKIPSAVSSIAATLFLAHTTSAAGFSGTQNLALYWGQNSYKDTGSLAQQNLSYYCANTNVDIIPMAFITNITSGTGGQPQVNFANSGYSCTKFPNTNLWDCPTYADDIKTCQQTYGKTILISIGGSAYTEAGFKSQAEAVSSANLIWNTFGPVNSSSGALRPFHDAVVDGFDFDIESKNSYFRAFALQLRALMDADRSKQYYMTAAPQCPFPDFMDPMFNNPQGGVPFDALFIQFYNNPSCDVSSYTKGTTTQKNFNLQRWQTWATSGSANKNVKLFLGVLGGNETIATGYRNPAGLKPIMNYAKGFANFGGVSVWDASQAYANKPFLNTVKTNLKAAATRRSIIGRRVAMVEDEEE